MPKVSVIVPVYGVEQYIEKCARSLFEQTLDDIEYLFIDDCTPDRSISILKQVLEEYPNRKSQVIIHRMEQNSGQAKVREWGMRNASGEYVIHCDSDDWVDTCIYSEMYVEAKNKCADIVYCDYIVEGGPNDQKIIYRGANNLTKDQVMKKLLTTPDLNSLWSALVKRSIIDKIVFPSGDQSEDKTMLIQLCWFADGIIGIEKPYYHYNDNPSSISNSITEEKINKRAKQVFENVDIILDFLEREKIMKKYNKYLPAYLFYAKGIYANLIANPIYYSLWKNKYRQYTKYYLLNPYIDWKCKIITVIFIIRTRQERKQNGQR